MRVRKRCPEGGFRKVRMLFLEILGWNGMQRYSSSEMESAGEVERPPLQ